MNDKKLNGIIGILIILAVSAAFFIYRSLSDKKDNNVIPQIDNVSVDAEGQNVSIIAEDKDSGKDMSLETETKQQAVYPDLNRPVIILDPHLSKETSIIAQEKISQLSADVRDNPELFGTWLDLASYRKLIGDYFGAIEIWEFIGENSNAYIPYNNLGMLYHYNMPDYVLSEKHFKTSITRNDTYISTYIELHFLYKDSYKEKSELADDILIEGLSKNPGNILLLSTLAEYYVGIGDISNAKKYYTDALTEARNKRDTAIESRLQAILNEL